jgi:hypothetical protein
MASPFRAEKFLPDRQKFWPKKTVAELKPILAKYI